ncbi:MAG TPA: GspH/FimT family protein [Crenalkalicoccus sp.]|nr:GspH/FimT family protein [Crenalkalicoccus sp.]
MAEQAVPGGAAAGARRAEAGFTLLEVIVVLVVLGLALGVFVSRGPPRSAALEIRAAAGQVAQALRQTRGRAIMLNRPVALTVDLGRLTYRNDGMPERALPPTLGVSVLAAGGDTLGGRLAAISFAPDGSSSGGHIELSDGRRRLRVGVDWLSGRVRVGEVVAGSNDAR